MKDGENSLGDGDDLTCISRFTSANVDTIESNCRAWCNAPCGVADAKVVFVTATSYTGNLGGLSGANTICQNAATSAGLSGTFKAWLSTSTTSAASNISTHASIPYVRRDGVLVANNWTDLTDGTLAAPINVTESGGTSTVSLVWTDSTNAGALNVSGEDCVGWTSAAGGSVWGRGGNVGSTSSWTVYDKDHCSTAYPIYCVQN